MIHKLIVAALVLIVLGFVYKWLTCDCNSGAAGWRGKAYTWLNPTTPATETFVNNQAAA